MADQRDVVSEGLERAQAAADSGELAEAIAELHRVLEAEPGHVEALARLSLIHQETHGSEAARAYADEAVRLHPDDGLALATAAWTRLRSGDADSARDYLARAELASDLGIAALRLIAFARLALGDLEASCDAARRALALAPNAEVLHLALGQALFELGEVDEAFRELSEAVALAPDLVPAQCALGLVAVHQEDWDSAAEALERAVRLDRSNASAHAYLGLPRAFLDDFRGARSAIRRATRLAGDDPDILGTTSKALFSVGDVQEGLKAARKRINLDPENPEAHLTYGLMALAVGDGEGVGDAFTALETLDPEAAIALAAEMGMTVLPAKPRRGPSRPAPAPRVSAAAAKGSVYQLKVTLAHVSPPVWRRILVTGDTRLSELHRIIQAAMPWSGGHLHHFEVGGIYYSDRSFDLEDAENEERARLADGAPGEKSRLRYEYDFGDGWDHRIVVEKVLDREPGVRYPICTAGKRSAPPEDVGGPWGYGAFLEAIRDPNHREHKTMREWFGGSSTPSTSTSRR